MHIDRRVVTMVNAAHNKVGFTVEHCMKRQFDTVGRRAGTFVNRQPHILTEQLIADRLRHSQRTGTARTGCIRRHYHNLAQRTEKLYQLTNSFRNDAVIIGNQY